MNIRYSVSIILSCLLLTLFGCSQDRSFTPDDTQQGARDVRLTVFAPNADESLKAALIENEGTLDLQARFRTTDKVSLFAVQDKVITKIGDIAFKELAEDGSKATIDFTLPSTVDASKPMLLIGYSGLNQKRIQISDDKLLMIADNVTANSQERFNAPVIFRIKDFTASSATVADKSVRFEHIGAYEVIHFTNKADEEITASNIGLTESSGYGVQRPWTYSSSYDSSVGKTMYPYYNLVDGSVVMKTDRTLGDYTSSPKIAPGATASVFSWYIPKNVPHPEMVLNFMDKTYSNFKSKEVISAGTAPMEVGKAYHAYGYWDGKKVTLTNSQGEAKPAAYIRVKTDIPVGQTIGVKAYVSYRNKALAFVDLNGNGEKDSRLEDAPASSYNAYPYTVAQPEITFYGKFETLNLENQQLTSVEISPVAMPYELNFKKNKLSAEALNKLFEQLPDINHLKTSSLITKKLFIDGNPGTSTCNAKEAIKKGWILDITLVDSSQPYVYLMMSTLTRSKKLYILAEAADADKDGLWIDLNGNAEKDPGEEISTDGKFHSFTYSTDNLILYGKYTKLDLSGNGNIFAFSSETNTTLKRLNLSGNNMLATMIDKKCKELEYLNLSGNKLMVEEIPLTIDHLTKLKSLNLANCGLPTIDVSAMKELSFINVEGNKIQELALTGKPNLKTIIATGNQLKALEFDSTKVAHIEIGGNALDTNALNALFKLLPDRTSTTPGGLWITQNPGVVGANVPVALGKNWDVDTKNLKAGNSGDRPDIMDGEDW